MVKLKKKNGEIEEGKIKELYISDLNEVLELQKEVMVGIKDKELYVPSTREEFLEIIQNNGATIGVITSKNELIAMATLALRGDSSRNYGTDIGVSRKELLKVCQVDCVFVKEEYRGNSLQGILIMELENLAREKGCEIICATASPLNIFSVNSFKKIGYEVVLEKIKYGGLRRYVLKKSLV